MREIKFKQPHVDIEGKFIDWFYWGFVNGGFIAPIRFDLPNYQYTSLHDKNGKEIYEGDIIHYEKGWMYPELNGTIEWVINGFYFVCPSHDVKWHLDKEVNAEIIGNIYENPELLEVK